MKQIVCVDAASRGHIHSHESGHRTAGVSCGLFHGTCLCRTYPRAEHLCGTCVYVGLLKLAYFRNAVIIRLDGGERQRIDFDPAMLYPFFF